MTLFAVLMLILYYALAVLSFFFARRMRKRWQRIAGYYVGYFFLVLLLGVIFSLDVELSAAVGLGVFIAYGLWHAKTKQTTSGTTPADRGEGQRTDEPAPPPTRERQGRITPFAPNPREFEERRFPPRR